MQVWAAGATLDSGVFPPRGPQACPVLLVETMEPERSGDSHPQAAHISRAGPWKHSSGPGTARQCSITGTPATQTSLGQSVYAHGNRALPAGRAAQARGVCLLSSDGSHRARSAADAGHSLSGHGLAAFRI